MLFRSHWPNKAYTQMQVSHHYMGQPHSVLAQGAEANLCGFSGGLVGSTCARSSLRSGLCAPQLPAGPPAPSSKTKRALGGAEHDCNLVGRVRWRVTCASAKVQKKKKKRNGKSMPSAQSSNWISAWDHRPWVPTPQCQTPARGAPTPPPPLPMPAWQWQEAGAWWPWRSWHPALAEQGSW